MKKITLWLFALFTCWQMNAQVNAYGFSQTSGTYNEITGGTVLATGTTDDTSYPAIPIGFTFVYGGTSFSDVSINANGMIALGTTITYSYTPLSDGFSSNNAIAALGDDLQGNVAGELSYLVTGSSPNQVLTIQWKNYRAYNTTGDNYNFQIKLYETSNNIDVVYGAFTKNATSQTNQVGLRGASNAIFNNRSTATDWSATTAGALNNVTCTLTPTVIPTSGLTFSWAPPSCAAPGGLNATSITATSATIGWNAAIPAPTGYEYVVSTSNTTPAGSGTATTNLSEAIASLSPQTTYYVFVRSNCGGPFSSWNSFSFVTACAPITTFPSLEPFATFLPNACWERGDGGDTTTGPATFGTSGFYQDGFGNVTTTGSFAYNIWLAAANDWIISPEYTIPATGYELKFDAAATNYNATSAVTNWESDDFVEVLVSTTGTTNWTVLDTYNDANVPSNTGTANVIDLDSYSGQTVRFAYRVVEGATDGTADLEFFVDNFQVRVSPTCPDQTGLIVGTITSTTADFSWDDLNTSGALGYEYAVTTSATPPASGTATTSVIYSASGLMPQTTYYLHVRSSCAAGAFGNWATLSFVTNCASVTSFIQNFDAVTTPAFPTCWAKVGAGGTTNTQVGSANSAPNTMYFASFSTASLAVVSMQQVSNLGAGTNRIKFDMRANFTVGGVVEFGYLTDPADAATFVSLTTFTASALTYSTFQYSPPAGSYSDYPAFRHTGSPGNSVLIDNVVWEANPACADQTGVVFANLTTTSVDTSWDPISGAAGYEYAVTTSVTPPASGTSTTATIYAASGLTPETLYYIHVRPMCSPGVYGAWASVSFYTGYCLPSSSGTASYVNNFSTTGGSQNISNLATGFTAGGYLNASSQFVEGYATSTFNFNSDIVGGTVGFSIWIDWNNDLVFDNATEKVFNTTSYSNGPFTGAIAIPAGTALGNYRMRITTDWNASNPSNPCAAATRAEFEDYTISVVAPPACVPPSASASGVTDVAATINWASVPSATLGYEYVLDNVATDPAGSGTATSAITYSASGLTQLTTYYFHIRSVCGVGTYSTWNTVSFTTLASPPVNDNCATAIVLTAGPLHTSNPVATSNVGATNSNPPAPGCASFLGGDVWFSVEVPASGNIAIETITGTITDTGLAVYSGTCGTLALIDCDDDSALNAGSNSLIELTGRTPGEILYINAWDYSNNNFGTFSVTAYDASLSSNSFDTTSFVAYPNPVKDVLNISYKSAINNIRVINLLGQEVLNTKTNTNDVQVNMSTLTSGAYIVNITVEDTVHTIKVIKE